MTNRGRRLVVGCAFLGAVGIGGARGFADTCHAGSGGSAAYGRYFMAGGGGDALPSPVKNECIKLRTTGCFRPHDDGCYFESGGQKYYGLNVGVLGACGDFSAESQAKYDFTPNLANCTMATKDLRRANFEGAAMFGTGLSKVDFQNANLNGVDLRAADLTAADLREASLSRAIICRKSEGGSPKKPRSADWTVFSDAVINSSILGTYTCKESGDAKPVDSRVTTCHLVQDFGARFDTDSLYLAEACSKAAAPRTSASQKAVFSGQVQTTKPPTDVRWTGSGGEGSSAAGAGP